MLLLDKYNQNGLALFRRFECECVNVLAVSMARLGQCVESGHNSPL